MTYEWLLHFKWLEKIRLIIHDLQRFYEIQISVSVNEILYKVIHLGLYVYGRF